MARKKKQIEGDESGGKQSGGLKPLLIMFLVLAVAAGGFYGYLALVKRAEATKQLRRTERNVKRLNFFVINNVASVDRIRSEQVEKVSDPFSIIHERALKLGIAQKIKIQRKVMNKMSSNPKWAKATLNVNYGKKEGYQFLDLLRFMESIERANPKVQIQSVNFGERDRGITNDTWRPSNMVVRAYTLTET